MKNFILCLFWKFNDDSCHHFPARKYGGFTR